MRPALSAIICLLLCGACTATSPPFQPTSDSTAALPSIAQVEERSAAAVLYTVSTGWPPLMSSPEAVAGGEYQNSMTLTAPANGFGWAVYGLNAREQAPTGLQLELPILSGSAYIALADYSTGRWELLELPESGTVQVPLTAANLKPTGMGTFRVYLALLAYAGAVLSCNTMQLDVAKSDVHWTSYVVDDEGYSGVELKLLTSEAGASYLFYINEHKPDLKYAQCPSGLPTTAEAWEIMGMTHPELTSPAKAPLDAQLVGGRPTVLWTYEMQGVDKLMLSWPEAALPAHWWDWHNSLIDVSGPFRPRVSLCDVNGAPVIAFSREFTGTQLAYVSVNSLDQATVTLADIAFYDGESPVLLALPDRLLICVLRGIGLELAVSGDLHPLGPNDWQVTGGHSSFEQDTQYELRLDGSGGLQLYANGWFCRFAGLNPQTKDWAVSRVIVGNALGVADGRPVIVGGRYQQVVCAWATRPDPQSGADWVYSLVEDQIDAGYFAVAEIEGQPVAAYMDRHSGTVKFAYME